MQLDPEANSFGVLLYDSGEGREGSFECRAQLASTTKRPGSRSSDILEPARRTKYRAR